MVKYIILVSMTIVLSNKLLSQEFSTLLNEDFNRQSTIIIQNQIRKELGNKTKSYKIQEIIQNLLPWSRMEGLNSSQFARTVVLLYKSEEAEIKFENNEELIPLAATFKGSIDEFLILSRFMKEAEDSRLPLLYRDELIARGIDNNWDALSVLIAGRLLILSRNEDFDTSLFLEKLIKEVPRRTSTMSFKEIQNFINRITHNFNNPINKKNLDIIQEDISRIKSSKKSQLSSIIKNKSRNLNNVFEEYGKLEIRRRPPAFLAENNTTNNQNNSNANLTHNLDNNLLNLQWEILNKSSYNKVVESWLGTKYKFGGNSRQGVDCSGYTYNVLIDPAINVPRKLIPRSAMQQAEIGTEVSNQNINIGDLVFFSASPNRKKITHVGLFMGDRNFSHASTTRGVVIQSMDSKWWKERYVTSRKIFQYIK